jgi:integrase
MEDGSSEAIMSRDRALVRPEAALSPLEQLVETARGYAQDSRASSTRKAYLSDFASFEAWCVGQGLSSAPTTPAAVAVYLASLAERGRKASTIERALAGIAWAQRARGFEWPKGHPAITTVMTGIRRRHGTSPQQKAPVIDEVLAAFVATLDDELVGLRDRALLTLGWFGAFRRSELVALTVADVAHVREGLIVKIRRSKSDQEGHGAEKGIRVYAGTQVLRYGGHGVRTLHPGPKSRSRSASICARGIVAKGSGATGGGLTSCRARIRASRSSASRRRRPRSTWSKK